MCYVVGEGVYVGRIYVVERGEVFLVVGLGLIGWCLKCCCIDGCLVFVVGCVFGVVVVYGKVFIGCFGVWCGFGFVEWYFVGFVVYYVYELVFVEMVVMREGCWWGVVGVCFEYGCELRLV